MSAASAPVTLLADCPAVLVPSGAPVVLREGQEVVVLQQLGASLTVQTLRGQLARVEAVDAAALGFVTLSASGGPGGALPQGAPGAAGAPEVDAGAVLDALRVVYDPEIPINVVDLGLIYRCEVSEVPAGGRRVEIDMSMTAPGCGMGDVLKADASSRVACLPGVAEVEVQLVFDPPWDLDRLSEAARLQLGMW